MDIMATLFPRGSEATRANAELIASAFHLEQGATAPQLQVTLLSSRCCPCSIALRLSPG